MMPQTVSASKPSRAIAKSPAFSPAGEGLKSGRNIFSLIMNGRLIASDEIVTLTIYAFDVAAIFLLLALWRFRSKELL